MCCCGKPTINGQINAYSWDGKAFMTYEPNPPALEEGDTLLWDEPGRCGGIDAHSHHFRLVKRQWGGLSLLVRHGGGDARLSLQSAAQLLRRPLRRGVPLEQGSSRKADQGAEGARAELGARHHRAAPRDPCRGLILTA